MYCVSSDLGSRISFEFLIFSVFVVQPFVAFYAVTSTVVFGFYDVYARGSNYNMINVTSFSK